MICIYTELFHHYYIRFLLGMPELSVFDNSEILIILFNVLTP